MDWKCPECGFNNREDMAKCICGYDANKPFRFGSQSAKEAEGNIWSSLEEKEKRRQTLNLKSFLLKLNGWQRLWVVFSVFSLLGVGVLAVKYFPDNSREYREQRVGQALMLVNAYNFKKLKESGQD